MARYEDAGHGQCYLRHPECAQILQDSFLEGHETRYRLIAWCIMPNHAHVLIKQGEECKLGDIVRRWKGSSSRKINLALKREGSLWGKDYFDRVIRDDEHFWNAVSYIHRNPVRAGLVTEAADWPYSSLGYGWPLPQS
ncbi:REP-associated tyrosine transposase [Roseibacillus persicicus]